MKLPAWLNPNLEPLKLTAAVSTVYALVTAIIDGVQMHSAPPEATFIAAAVAVAALFIRTKVTPVAKPRAKDGTRLVRADNPAPGAKKLATSKKKATPAVKKNPSRPRGG